jgi:hypothetical protein
LRTPVPNVRPLTPDYSERPLPVGTPIILVSAQNSDFKMTGRDPILSPCSVTEYSNRTGDRPSQMMTDCDLGGGSSGGVDLFRGDDGKLYAKAMHTSHTNSDYTKLPNFSPYNIATNTNFEVVIDRSFLQWFADPAAPVGVVKQQASEISTVVPAPPRAEKLLGLTLASLTNDLRGKYRVTSGLTGVLITSVDRGSMAELKGLAAGDIITALGNSKALTSPDDVRKYVEELKGAGQKSVLFLTTYGLWVELSF